MFLRELFLTEMTEEDRAIISLSSSLVNVLRKVDLDQPMPINVGKIGDFLTTPLTALEDIDIVIDSSDNMETHLGEWLDGTMKVNADYIDNLKLGRILTHELRHALDDYKSDFKANASSRYSTAKKSEYRNVDKDPYLGNLAYKAQPAEINARFVEVLDLVTRSIKKGMKAGLTGEELKSTVMTDFKRAMEGKYITQLFPEKEKSKDYKRLMSRAMDFITKELAHATQSNK